MKAKVTEQGVMIPPEFFGDANEVDIVKKNDSVIIKLPSFKDPLLSLGQSPVSCQCQDASTNHDDYLYNSL